MTDPLVLRCACGNIAEPRDAHVDALRCKSCWARFAVTGSAPVAYMNPSEHDVHEAFVWQRQDWHHDYTVAVYRTAPASPAVSTLPEGWNVRVTPFEVQVRGPDGKGYSGSRTPKSKDGLAGYTLVKLVLALLDRDALLAASMGGDRK